MKTPESRVSYVAARHVTLNGRPASVSGMKNPFATVATRDGSGIRAEFSWETVARIFETKGAAFITD